MVPMTIDWSRFAEVIRTHQRFLLTSHIRPDCDALGSELGMAAILDQLGKDVKIVNGQESPAMFRFLDPDRRIHTIHQTITPAELQDREMVMILDTSAWVQLGPMAETIQGLPARRMVVDHHVSQDDLGAESFKDTTAEATGRLVVEAADALQVPLTPLAAQPLFAALATDTGWFRFGSAGAGTYRVGARLVQAGASPAEIFRQLYEQDTLGRVRLRGVILQRTAVELDGRLAHTYVLQEDFAQSGALPSDTEDVINMTLAIAGVEFAVILVEQAAGGFKISFRSRCPIDCSRLAEKFRGGGHKAAAGGYAAGSLSTAQPEVLAAVRQEFAALDAPRGNKS
jgi:bifunctional oligoribonuclease and PAP phosphatase NrnA